MDVNNKELELVLFRREYFGANFVQVFDILNWESLTAKSLSKFFILGFWVQVSYTVFFWISFKFLSATVDSVVVDNKNDTSQLVSGHSLTFHGAESKGTVTHDTHTPSVGIGGSGANQSSETDAHRTKSSCVKLASWLFMSKNCSTNVHCIGSFSNHDHALGQVSLDDCVWWVISHWNALDCHEFFIYIQILFNSLLQGGTPLWAVHLVVNWTWQHADCFFHVPDQSWNWFDIVTHFLCMNVCLNNLYILVETGCVSEMQNPIQSCSQKYDNISFFQCKRSRRTYI